MSFNILSEEWDAAAVLPGRDVRVPATILNYHPDVAALQEVSNAWYPILENYIGHTYKFVTKKTPSGKGTYTTLIYNDQTTDLIDDGIHIYSVGNSERLRSIVWGLFESKVSGERYIVFSTHWDVGAEKASQRLTQAKEMAALAKQLSEKHNADVFACGDYNASENTTEYRTFLSEAGFVDAKTDAKVKNRACKTYHTLFQNVSTDVYESIDHITFSAKIAEKVLYYNTLINDYVIDASDHCPIYIDIKTSK
jgi:endonuclease/exonuclease/phosphatase family metal-dependent hydrolase